MCQNPYNFQITKMKFNVYIFFKSSRKIKCRFWQNNLCIMCMTYFTEVGKEKSPNSHNWDDWKL